MAIKIIIAMRLKISHLVSKPHLPGDELTNILVSKYPDSKVHGTNMGPIWGRQDPGGSHVGPMNFAIWVPL